MITFRIYLAPQSVAAHTLPRTVFSSTGFSLCKMTVRLQDCDS